MKNFWSAWRSFIRTLRTRKWREGKIVLDKKDLKAIGRAVSQPVTKAVARLQVAHAHALIRQLLTELKRELPKALGTKPQRQPGEIKIKEPFINPMEEDVGLRPRFSREPPRKKTSGADIKASVTALKQSQWQSKKTRLG